MNQASPAAQRAVNRALWRERGEIWSLAAPEGRSTDDRLNQELIAAAGLAPGQTVLDIAGGSGDPTISIASHIGERGRVIACDLAAEMLAGARRRAARLGLANITCAVADMESLAFADGSFDAVTCRFGLMFPPGRESAVAEALRVVKPGGRVAYLVWGPEQDNTVHRTLRPATLAYFGHPPGPPARRHILGAPGALSALLAAAGLTDVEERELTDERIAAPDERFWARILERNFAPKLAEMTGAECDALDAAIRAAFEKDRVDGGYCIRTHVRIGVGTKAA